MQPEIIRGSNHKDDRGKLTFNNNFKALKIKRVYTIENKNVNFIRGWQGHKVEHRWYSAMVGSFEIKFVKIDNWNNPSIDLLVNKIVLSDQNFDILHIPPGFVTTIQALNEDAKLLLFADHLLSEIQDEFRFPLDYFA